MVKFMFWKKRKNNDEAPTTTTTTKERSRSASPGKSKSFRFSKMMSGLLGGKKKQDTLESSDAFSVQSDGSAARKQITNEPANTVSEARPISRTFSHSEMSMASSPAAIDTSRAPMPTTSDNASVPLNRPPPVSILKKESSTKTLKKVDSFMSQNSRDSYNTAAGSFYSQPSHANVQPRYAAMPSNPNMEAEINYWMYQGMSREDATRQVMYKHSSPPPPSVTSSSNNSFYSPPPQGMMYSPSNMPYDPRTMPPYSRARGPPERHSSMPTMSQPNNAAAPYPHPLPRYNSDSVMMPQAYPSHMYATDPNGSMYSPPHPSPAYMHSSPHNYAYHSPPVYNTPPPVPSSMHYPPNYASPSSHSLPPRAPPSPRNAMQRTPSRSISTDPADNDLQVALRVSMLEANNRNSMPGDRRSVDLINDRALQAALQESMEVTSRTSNSSSRPHPSRTNSGSINLAPLGSLSRSQSIDLPPLPRNSSGSVSSNASYNSTNRPPSAQRARSHHVHPVSSESLSRPPSMRRTVTFESK